MNRNLTYLNVNKIFDEHGKNPVHALKDVSFTINSGELFCMLGPSGCGKTTLLRSTAGLEELTSGQIMYGDRDMTTIPPFRRNIGMVFQSFALYPHMSVFENVAYGLRIRKMPEKEIRQRVTEVMELVGLMDELKRNPSPTGLSGGQQQRVAIARALVYQPDLLLLDEPLANLDAKLRRYMRAEIRRIQKATNITTIFVTHDQEEAMAIGDRLAVLRDGVVEQIGSSNELYTGPNDAFVANFIGKMNFFNATPAGENRARLISAPIEITVKPKNNRLPKDVQLDAETKIVVGARPEQLIISDQRTAHSLEGEVQIIQHLGQVVRYEVALDSQLNVGTIEVDMPMLLEGVHERDTVFVSFKEDLPFLFLPEVIVDAKE